MDDRRKMDFDANFQCQICGLKSEISGLWPRKAFLKPRIFDCLGTGPPPRKKRDFKTGWGPKPRRGVQWR